MGGKGSGGLRPNAGRKPWKHRASVLRADAPVSPSHVPSAPPVLSVPAAVTKPDGLSAEVSLVWDVLASVATAEGTLVAATAYEFRELCELAVQQARVRDRFAAEPQITEFSLKLEKAYRGLTQRLEQKLRAFKLAPMGKEIAPAAGREKPKSALEQLKDRRKGLHVV